MGFKPPKTLYKLKFEDPALDRLEVTIRGVDVNTMLELQSFADLAAVDDPGKMSPAEIKASSNNLKRTVTILADALVSWNLEADDDTPLPVSYDTLSRQEPSFVMKIVEAWSTAIAGVNTPLEKGSNSGVTSPAVSIPTEPLSPSPSNTPEPSLS
jgi:hypothetical protein